MRPSRTKPKEPMRKEALIRSAETSSRDASGACKPADPSAPSSAQSSAPTSARSSAQSSAQSSLQSSAASSRDQSPAATHESSQKSWESSAECSGRLMRCQAKQHLVSAKEQMDQSGNLKTSIKDQVMLDLRGLYDCVISLCDARSSMQAQMERMRSQHLEQTLEIEQIYIAKLDGMLAQHFNGPSMRELHTEIQTLRGMVVFEVLEAQKKQAQTGPTPFEIMGEIKALRQLIVMESRKSCSAVENIQELKKELKEAVVEAKVSSSSSAPADTSMLQDDIKHLSAALTDTKAQLREIALPPTSGTSDKPSYAAVTRRSAPLPPRHSLIVSSQDLEDTSTNVLDKVRGAVDARTTGIRVDSVRKARDQKVVIGCGSRDEAKKLRTRIEQQAKGLTVVEARTKDPLVVIRDVLSYNTDDDILCSLKRQNTNITGDIPDEEYRASVKYRRRARNSMESHIVLQVSPRLWQKLTTVGEVHIDLQRRPVHDQSPLIQCTKCLGFGHGRKLCKESADLCSHCGDPHLRSECPNWIAATPASCRNCKTAKAERYDHSAFSTECPIRRRWDTIARSSVAYHSND